MLIKFIVFLGVLSRGFLCFFEVIFLPTVIFSLLLKAKKR